MADATRPPNLPALSPAPSLVAPAFDSRRVRRWAGIVCLVLLGAYLLLQNPYWVPGGDSDFYVAAARSLARGQGYLYNGLPVAISPPGWPWVMAKVMKLSPTFLALKLTAMLSMFGSLVICYFIALRFLRPGTAARAIVLAGLLMPVYSLTYFTHSEGFYCLISAVALLLALRLREGRGGPAHIAALIACGVALPYIRYAGLFQLLPIVGVLMSGPKGLPLGQRHWKTAIAVTLVIVGTFIGVRESLKLSEAELKDIELAGGAAGSGEDTAIEEGSTEIKQDQILAGPKDKNKGFVREYAERIGQSGKWFAWLLWQPSRFVEFSKPAALIVAIVGWGVILLLSFLAYHEARRGEWIWVALALYTGGICIGWNNVNSRYFVPVAPLITVGLVLATLRLSERFPPGSINWSKWLRRGLVYSILLCNLAMYGVDVIVMRSAKFYETFEAGQHKDLISAANFLVSPQRFPDLVPTTGPASTMPAPSLPIADAKLLVNQRYENIGRIKDSKAGTRAMVLLTDRVIKPLDGRLTRIVRPNAENEKKLARLMRDRRYRSAEWYFAQDKVVPWRVWHFRVPDWLYLRMTKNPVTATSSGWALYHYDRINSTFVQVPYPPLENWPTRVPGM
jgi:hypothetical protein